MSKKSDEQSVDRRASRSGIKSGGRRKSDRELIGGRAKKIGIAVSFFVSACILIWAFSAPFRGGNAIITFGQPDDKSADVEANPVSHSDDRVSDDEYVQEMLFLEEEIREQLAEKNRVPKNLPGKAHASKKWKHGLKQRVRDAKLLAEVAEGDIEPGTLQWHAQQDLKEYLQDAPQ